VKARLKNIMSLVGTDRRAVRIVATKRRARRSRPTPPLCVGLQTSHESLTEGLFLRIKLTSKEWAAMRSQFGTAWQTMKCAVTISDRIGDN